MNGKCDICGNYSDDFEQINCKEVCWDCRYEIKTMIEEDDDLTEEYAAHLLSMGIRKPINCRRCNQREACKDMGDYPQEGFRRWCDGFEKEESEDNG